MEFDWKQANVNVTASGREIDVQNTGNEAVINLLDKRRKNAQHTASNNMTTAIYSDGSSYAGKQVGGFQHIIADTPTSGSVGGIDRSDSTNTFWRNQTSGDVTFNSGNPDATNSGDVTLVRSEMMDMWLETKRGNDTVDLITADTSFYTTFWQGLTDIQRVASSEEAVAGFKSIKFVTADVVHEDSGIPSGHMYFLNTDYIYLKVREGRNWQPKRQKASVNQDAIVIPLYWAGNLTCSNAARQGVIYT